MREFCGKPFHKTKSDKLANNRSGVAYIHISKVWLTVAGQRSNL